MTIDKTFPIKVMSIIGILNRWACFHFSKEAPENLCVTKRHELFLKIATIAIKYRLHFNTAMQECRCFTQKYLYRSTTVQKLSPEDLIFANYYEPIH